MGFSGRTAHNDLGLYVGTDIPSYLVDFNGNQEKIDDLIYGVQQQEGAADIKITALESLTEQHTGSIGALQANLTSQQTALTALQQKEAQDIAELDDRADQLESNITNVGGALSSLQTATEKAIRRSNNYIIMDGSINQVVSATPAQTSGNTALTAIRFVEYSVVTHGLIFPRRSAQRFAPSLSTGVNYDISIAGQHAAGDGFSSTATIDFINPFSNGWIWTPESGEESPYEGIDLIAIPHFTALVQSDNAENGSFIVNVFGHYFSRSSTSNDQTTFTIQTVCVRPKTSTGNFAFSIHPENMSLTPRMKTS